jgi:hypothetical protein
MKVLNTLTEDPDQQMTFVLADGSSIQLQFQYRRAIQRWIVNIGYGGFIANGIILSTHPNLLRVWRNIIPFGIAVASTDMADPFQLQDFTNGRVTVYILDSTTGNTDVDNVEVAYF